MQRKHISLLGCPAVGKRTVGRIIARHARFPLFDNAQTVDLAVMLHPIDSPAFRRFRDKLRASFYREASKSSIPGLVSTYCYRHPTNASYLLLVDSLLQPHGWKTYTFLLVADRSSLLARVQGADRRDKHTFHHEQYIASWLESSPKYLVPPFPACVVLETTRLSATEVAELVMKKAGVAYATERST